MSHPIIQLPEKGFAMVAEKEIATILPVQNVLLLLAESKHNEPRDAKGAPNNRDLIFIYCQYS